MLLVSSCCYWSYSYISLCICSFSGVCTMSVLFTRPPNLFRLSTESSNLAKDVWNTSNCICWRNTTIIISSWSSSPGPRSNASYGRWTARCSMTSKNPGGNIFSKLHNKMRMFS
ncbi:unnamed protein product [Brassica oleracea var. botrytis]